MERIKTEMNAYTTVLLKNVVCEESADAIVPDTEPDLLRIICAQGSVDLQEESFQKDRAMVSGTIRACVLYLPEKEEKPRKIEIPISFAHMEEAKGIGEGCQGMIGCTVLHVHARGVNSRKISVTASLQVSYEVYRKTKTELCTDILSPEYPLEILQGKKVISLPVKMQSKPLTILEDLELTEKNSAFLPPRCEIQTEDMKMMPGKAVIRGSARVQQTVLREDGQITAITHQLPFTHILEMEEGEEGDLPQISFGVRNISCVQRDDHTISVGVTADTLLRVYEEREIPMILDLYQMDHDLKTRAENVVLYGEEPIPQREFTYETIVETGNEAIQILDCYGVWEKQLQSRGLPINVHLLYLADDQKPYSLLRRFTVLLEGDAELIPEQVMLTVAPVLSGKDGIRLKIRGQCQGMQETRTVVSDLQEVQLASEEPRETKPFHVVVRYMEQGENLWEAAKKYHTTRQAIREANHLPQTEEQAEQGILLIPVKG